ncbi:hypothetical protein AB833_13755 [Chromatiales bacterium (ex Bugula neritina AB1)]|nr:hypothetical protein AB833_13755 [Chromatiales bacterium (ex Bugula neritina AB1)]
MSTSEGRRLFAVDCDGTLFDGDGYPSQRTCKVVQRLVDAGHSIVAVTGRSRLTASDRLASVRGINHVVCSNGAYAWDIHNDRLVWETGIPQAVVADIVLRLRRAAADVSFGWETRGGIGFDDAFIKLDDGSGELESGGQSGDPWSQDLYKLKVRRPDVVRLQLQEEITDLLGSDLCEITTSGAPFVEITAPGSHKGSGLEKTAAAFGFEMKETIAFGDNHNDLPMFSRAGHAVAMGNAIDVVKAKADAVTLPNTEHGVANYIEMLLDSGTL